MSANMYNQDLYSNGKAGNNSNANRIEEVLYEKLVPVRLSSNDRDDKIANLTITVCLLTPHLTAGSSSQTPRYDLYNSIIPRHL